MEKGELFSLETQDFLLSFYGPLPSKQSFALQDFEGGAVDEPRESRILKHITMQVEDTKYTLFKVELLSSLFEPESVSVQLHMDGTIYLPLLFENIEYQFQLTNLGTLPYELWHDHSAIRAGFVSAPKHKTSSGSFNFRSNVGITAFEIRDGNRPVFRITIAVFSIKITFLEERQAMLRELSLVHHALVLELFRPTVSLGTTELKKNLGVEWLTTFLQLSNEVLQTLRRIESKAHRQITTNEDLVPVHKIRKANKTLTKQIARHGEIEAKRNLTLAVRRTQVNTPENRYIKFLGNHLVRVGRKWIRFVRASDDRTLQAIVRDELMIQRIEQNFNVVSRLFKSSFWKEVGEETPTLHNLTNFLFQDLFVRFFRLYKTINRALNVHQIGDRLLYTLSMENLYELWTYCKLAEITAGILGNSSREPIKTKVDAFQAVLRTGINARVKLTDSISISAQRKFGTNPDRRYFSPILSQQPDLVFDLQNETTLHLMDAKYRIAVLIEGNLGFEPLNNRALVSMPLRGQNMMFRPQDDDINTMHRYKDAIQSMFNVSEEGTSQRPVKFGLILYPHKPTNTEASLVLRNLDSIERYLIGAVPLAPGEPDSEWLEKYKQRAELLPPDKSSEQIRIFAYTIAKMLGSV